MSNIKRCPLCKRNKAKAIQEQASRKAPCDFIDCPFAEEIKKAIEDRKKITVVKKSSPVINVKKKPKPIIKVEKK